MKRLFFFLIFLVPFTCNADTQAVVILLDVTKTIPLDDFAKSKGIAQQLIQQNASGNILTVYAFGSKLREIDPAKLNEIERNDMRTSFYDAIYDVAQTLESIHADRKAIVLITDGLDNSSATILEDTISYTKANGIAVYGIGSGKYDRKSLERIARLTGGKFFPLGQNELVAKINAAIANQKEILAKATKTPSKQAPATSRPVAPTSHPEEVPRQEKSSSYLFWIAGIAVTALILSSVIFLIVRAFRTDERRICPSCSRKLEQNQMICPNCSAPETVRVNRSASPATQEIGTSEEEIAQAIPAELLQKKPVTEEDLSRTFVLMETPMLVVRKGKNLGQTISLNRAFPVSIGRSRVNEIRLDDVSVSSQHCRIIPEKGKHVLYDLGSTNGTFINDKKVQKAFLKEGDTIKIGETQFLYKIEQYRS